MKTLSKHIQESLAENKENEAVKEDIIDKVVSFKDKETPSEETDGV